MFWQTTSEAATGFFGKVSRFAQNYAQELPDRLWDLAVLTALVFVVFGIEAFVEGRQKTSLQRLGRRRTSAGTDLLGTVLTTLDLLPLLGIAMTGGLIYFLLKLSRQWLGSPAPLDLGHPLLTALVFLLLVDFFLTGDIVYFTALGRCGCFIDTTTARPK